MCSPTPPPTQPRHHSADSGRTDHGYRHESEDAAVAQRAEHLRVFEVLPVPFPAWEETPRPHLRPSAALPMATAHPRGASAAWVDASWTSIRAATGEADAAAMLTETATSTDSRIRRVASLTKSLDKSMAALAESLGSSAARQLTVPDSAS